MTESTPPHPVLDGLLPGRRRPAVVRRRPVRRRRPDTTSRVGRMLDLGSGLDVPASGAACARVCVPACGCSTWRPAPGWWRAAGSRRSWAKPAAWSASIPAAGMLGEARKALAGPLVQGRAEALPFRDGHFDMLSMGFALRHVPDLDATFQRVPAGPQARRAAAAHSRCPARNPRPTRWLIRMPLPARPALHHANQHGQPPGRAAHEVLLGHHRPVRSGRDNRPDVSARAASPTATRRVYCRLHERVRGGGEHRARVEPPESGRRSPSPARRNAESARRPLEPSALTGPRGLPDRRRAARSGS